MTDWYLYMSQYRLGIPDFVTRAQAAEASGFDGVAFFDHLETPGAPQFPVWEAMGIATWVAAKTTTLRVGHLVLCDAFRHPAVLAKQAVTLSEASEGRFDLGLGSGSMPDELAKFGLAGGNGLERIRRLDRDLTAIREYWGSGESGEGAQAPTPTQPIPIVVGGTGPRMLEVVRKHANWWNLPADRVNRLPELVASIGKAQASVQQMVGFAGRGSDRGAVVEASTRRWGHLGPGLVCGDAEQLIEYFAGLRDQGAQRFYVWFADGATLKSVEEFGSTVIADFPR